MPARRWTAARMTRPAGRVAGFRDPAGHRWFLNQP